MKNETSEINRDELKEKLLSEVKSLPQERIPIHVAIIMDGNGRWAKRRNLPRTEGHRAGIAAVKRIVRFAPQTGVRVLSLFTFSTENWRRPRDEVKTLMNLLRDTTLKELNELIKNRVRLVVSGRFDELPWEQRAVLSRAMKMTKNGDLLTLNLALNYGGRAEIIDATRSIARMVKNGELEPEDIDERIFAKNLYTAELPDPDLLIRTSGELRISNFMLWQTAYTELYFTEVLWPDFDEVEFCRAILDYSRRERRFGKVSEQL